MNITRLPMGELASATSDRIQVWRDVAGIHHWSGALMTAGVAVFSSGTGHTTRAAAESEGIVWAESHGISMLILQCDGGTGLFAA